MKCSGVLAGAAMARSGWAATSWGLTAQSRLFIAPHSIRTGLYEREFKGLQKFEPVSRTHESQVAVLHIGRNDQEGYFYHVMELADDQRTGPQIDPESYMPRTLSSELKAQARLPADQCLQIGLALTTALDHVHKYGLIHRDIKPSNIIFVNGRPKLADIGLVAAVDATCSFVGTEGYLPPEGPGTPQGDLYSLGKVLYEASTGKDRRDFPEPAQPVGIVGRGKGHPRTECGNRKGLPAPRAAALPMRLPDA